MEKNARLADIYIKIYNKKPLMMEDLAFLAKYDRECFEKTCHNLIYNIPEAEKLMKPIPDEESKNGQEKPDEPETNSRTQEEMQSEDASREEVSKAAVSGSENGEEQASQISALLDNLRKMEWQEIPMPNLDADKVKNLLGSLYMEMLFPHNDKYRYFNLEENSHRSIFNRKV